jgi:DNA-binding MarR family transcriptional regulator
VVNAWRREWPTLDFSPVSVMARLIRVVHIVEPQLDDTLRQFGLNRASFDTLTALRRSGRPYRLSARQLAASCMRTSATLTTRIARLAEAGLVTREPDPRDARSVLITLTDEGRAVIDAAAPRYLAAEAELLAGLTAHERRQLGELLRLLLLSIEAPDESEETLERPIDVLGLRVEPPHIALRKRRSVGLPDRVGLLVSALDRGGSAAAAGLQIGDLITQVDGQEFRSAPMLNQALEARGRNPVRTITLVRGADEMRVQVTPTSK